MTKILFNITHGFQARMLLRSNVSQTLLAAGAKLIVLSPNANEEYFRAELTHPQIGLESTPSKFSRLETNVIQLRQYLLMNPALGATLNHKNEQFRRESPKKYFACRVGNTLLGRVPWLRRGYQVLERAAFAGKEFDDLLLRHQPDLVVTGTPGYHPQDVHLLRAARRLKTPTATVLLSWDNLTSKGYMGAVPDRLLVWSQLMADEAVRYHHYPRAQIDITGAPQFDLYHDVRANFDRAAWRREHGIRPDAALIVYGTINPGILPHEPQIVQQIVQAVRSGQFQRPIHLWVRLHPQSVRGIFSRTLAPYRELAGPDVTIEEPPVRSEQLAWDLPQSDAGHLAHLLAAADVVSTPSSTLVIDSACAGTPIVNVLFDGPTAVEPARSVARFAHYTHYRQILETGGIAIARSIEQFVQMAGDYLNNRQLHQQQRQNIITQQLGALDGQAGQRTGERLLRLAQIAQRDSAASEKPR